MSDLIERVPDSIAVALGRVGARETDAAEFVGALSLISIRLLGTGSRS